MIKSNVEARGQASVKASIMLFSIFFSLGLLSAGLGDDMASPVTDSLAAVTVTADKGVVISRKDTLSVSPSLTITDVLLQSPGLHVGDNGGYAGLKTVSLRGLGSAHTSLYLDGVRVGNLQSGQNDLSMIGLETCGSAVVDYAQNSISFNTLRPEFSDLPVSGSFRMAAGSFGTYRPSARLDFRLSDNLSLSANAAGIISKGNYSYGDGLERENNDISQVRAGLDLFGIMNGGDYHVKAFYNGTERGTPGSVAWPSADRQKDRNVFLQGNVRRIYSPLYTLQLSAKGAYDEIFYSSSWGDSHYAQKELQLNTAHYFKINDWWKVSVAADVSWDGLSSTNYNASRWTLFSAAASSFVTDRFSANVALEYTGAFDVDASARNAISPSLDMRFQLMDGLDIVAFGRRAYRVPVFNELYYVGYGNPDLKPEDAWLTDLGLDFNRSIGHDWSMRVKVDGFANFLKDKIVSAPTEADPNIWAPYNVGKVRSLGVDALAGAGFTSGEWILSLDIRYSLQSAVDKTPDSYTLDQQIPYVSRHTVVANLKASWKGWSFNPVWQLRSGRTDGYGNMPDWNSLDLTLTKSFEIKDCAALGLHLSVRNAFDKRYEIVSGYPMPGRSLVGCVEFKF